MYVVIGEVNHFISFESNRVSLPKFNLWFVDYKWSYQICNEFMKWGI